MKNNQKGFANIVLIAVIVVLIAVAGYFVFIKEDCRLKSSPDLYVCGSYFSHLINSSTKPVLVNPTQTPNVAKDEAVNWKTYQSDTYGFKIKYPSEWISKSSWSENGGFFYIAFGIANTIDAKPFTTIKVYPNQTTLDKFMRYFDYINAEWKDITLNNVAAKEIESGQYSKPFILIASVKNSYGYELASTVFGDNINTMRKMSSTFKFTK